MDIPQYLNRINVSQVEEPSYDFLARLQWLHMATVPFENLDVLNGRPIRLHWPLLFDKIVNRRRGGFCYELNGLFAWLLETLGFSISMLSAGVYNADRREFGPEYDHMTLLVRLERPYLVDVGFGDSVRQPLPMPDGEVEEIGGHYRIRPPSGGEKWYQLQRFQNGDWQPQYRFSTRPRGLSQYQARCDFVRTSPDSHFRRGLICTRITENGRISLTDHHLIITGENGLKRRFPVSHPDQLKQWLWDHFGITIA